MPALALFLFLLYYSSVILAFSCCALKEIQHSVIENWQHLQILGERSLSITLSHFSTQHALKFNASVTAKSNKTDVTALSVQEAHANQGTHERWWNCPVSLWGHSPSPPKVIRRSQKEFLKAKQCLNNLRASYPPTWWMSEKQGILFTLILARFSPLSLIKSSVSQQSYDPVKVHLLKLLAVRPDGTTWNGFLVQQISHMLSTNGKLQKMIRALRVWFRQNWIKSIDCFLKQQLMNLGKKNRTHTAAAGSSIFN